MQATAVDDGEPVTLIVWDGRDNFEVYEGWLRVAVEVIDRDLGQHVFGGALEWDGEASGDLGRLTVRRHGDAIQVEAMDMGASFDW